MRRGTRRLAMAFDVVDYRDIARNRKDSDYVVQNWVTMLDTFGFALTYAYPGVSDDPGCSLAEWGNGPYDKLILGFEPGFVYR